MLCCAVLEVHSQMLDDSMLVYIKGPQNEVWKKRALLVKKK